MGYGRKSGFGKGFMSRRGTVLAGIVGGHAVAILGLWNTGNFERERAEELSVEVVLLSEQVPAPPPPVPVKLDPVRPVEVVAPQFQAPVDSLPPTAITVAQVAVVNVSKAGDADAPAIIDDVEYVYQSKPRYPPKAKKARLQGIVYLMVLIDEEGNPKDVRVHRSSGFEMLDTAAREAVGTFRFRPHRVNGVAHRARAIVPVQFSLAHA